MSKVTPSVKAELRVDSSGKNDTVLYRIIGAQNTTRPRLGSEMTEKEVDKFNLKHPGIRFNIVMA